MAFCRRCGDIVVGPRCKCGGTAVAPSIQFNAGTSNQTGPDRWSRTYVTRDKSPTRPAPPHRTVEAHEPKDAPVPARQFPRPLSTTNLSLSNRVSSHIQSSSTHRPSSPLKQTFSNESPSPPAADILPCPTGNSTTLSKAYGSVLQPKETLTTFSCFMCFAPFPPDATIYPDPANPTTTTRFLCKPCFVQNGGSKGDCVACSRPVLILASEGGFVENSGKLWHKRCFQCNGCFKEIGDKPMVDLLGRPSCEGCFDTCLKRPTQDSPRHYSNTPERRSKPGGTKGGLSRESSPAIEELNQLFGIKSRDGSPAIDELHHRFGIKSREGSPAVVELSPAKSLRRRESSPALEELTQRLASMRSTTPSPSPKRVIDSTATTPLLSDRLRQSTGSRPGSLNNSPAAKATEDAVEEMKKRFLRKSTNNSPSPISYLPSLARSESSFSQDSLSVSSSTPDLMSDYSDTTTQFSEPTTPPPFSPPTQRKNLYSPENISKLPSSLPTQRKSLYSPTALNKCPISPPAQRSSTYTPDSLTRTPTRKVKSIPDLKILDSPQTLCYNCAKPLLKTTGGGRFVTVPEESSKCLPPKTYHVECFRCAVCDNTFEETKGKPGQAVFVRSSSGYCHVGCATPERIVVKPISKPSSISTSSPSRHDEKPPKTAPPTITSFPRFGSSVTCRGCHKSVSPMEKGVVPGPQGSRWHTSCLVCGGKGGLPRGRRDPNQPGCGKRLDSAAKTDGDGGVWCRDCLSLLPNTSQIHESPTRLTPSHTGGIFSRFPNATPRSDDRIQGQLTGATTIARQFTGGTTLAQHFTGLGQGMLTTQLTGGSLSPTRQLLARSPSPTKMMGSGRPFPRPKSVIGVRGGKSVDEGRGMFLVRQMTGGGGVYGLER